MTKSCATQSCVCVTQLCVCDKDVRDQIVSDKNVCACVCVTKLCERWCVTKLCACVTKLCEGQGCV